MIVRVSSFCLVADSSEGATPTFASGGVHTAVTSAAVSSLGRKNKLKVGDSVVWRGFLPCNHKKINTRRTFQTRAFNEQKLFLGAAFKRLTDTGHRCKARMLRAPKQTSSRPPLMAAAVWAQRQQRAAEPRPTFTGCVSPSRTGGFVSQPLFEVLVYTDVVVVVRGGGWMWGDLLEHSGYAR